jgi:ComF family protein
LAETLALLIAEHLFLSGKNKEEIWQNSILIPIPLDKKKLKSRGYNQAEELAKELSKILKVPVISNNLIKTRVTLPQVELSAEKRGQNLKNAFLVKSPEQIKGKKIFLVDDVYTTGSTMEECSRVLRDAAAKQVWGIVIAREG